MYWKKHVWWLPLWSKVTFTFQYLSFMYGQCRRKRDIPAYWFFTCKCDRCGSPTDLDSHMSAILCQKCVAEDGSRHPVLPVDAEDAVAGKWQCTHCNSE